MERKTDLKHQIEDMVLLAEVKGWANLELPHDSLEGDIFTALEILKVKALEVGPDFLITLCQKNGHWELGLFIVDNPEFGGD